MKAARVAVAVRWFAASAARAFCHRKSSIGKLDQGLDEAQARGWRVFAYEAREPAP
ncbi:MAG TPA: hypothetical protein VMR31_03755 [Myxococcota bacterium]|nr:hypothetical protein [Myxococcota bacterium]